MTQDSAWDASELRRFINSRGGLVKFAKEFQVHKQTLFSWYWGMKVPRKANREALEKMCPRLKIPILEKESSEWPAKMTLEDRAYVSLFYSLYKRDVDEKDHELRFANAIYESANSDIVNQQALNDWSLVSEE